MSLLNKAKFLFPLLHSFLWIYLSILFSLFPFPPLALLLFSPSVGFLQITPEGSPQAQRKGELGGETDVLGSFCLRTPEFDFPTGEMSEELQVSPTGERSVTTVTKTTRHTQHMVTTETRTSKSSTKTTIGQQVSDLNY